MQGFWSAFRQRLGMAAVIGLAIVAFLAFLFLGPWRGEVERSGETFAAGDLVASETEAEGTPVRIAFAGNLGAAPDSAEGMLLRGVLMFVDQINREGGVADRPIEVELFDDKGEPGEAVAVAERIAESDEIVAVIGHGTTLTSATAAAVYQRANVPVIAPITTDEALTRGNDWAFRTIFTDELQAKVLANYIRSVLGYESVAIIADTGSYAQGLVQAFVAAAGEIALNASQVYTLSDDSTVPQLNDIARRLALMTRLESVLLAITPEQAARMVPILRAEGVTADLIGAESLSLVRLSDAEAAETGRSVPDFMDDLLITLPFVPDTASSTARAFLGSYEGRFGEEALWPALFGFDSGLIIAAAVGRAAETMPDADAAPSDDIRLWRSAVREALLGMNAPQEGIRGLTGLLYFNENGDVTRPIYLGRVTRGELSAAAQQLQIIDDPERIDLLREEGENTIEVEDVFLQVTQVVRTGIKINSISDIDGADNTFEADFNIWFRFNGEFDPQAIVFPDAVEPIELGEPKQKLDLGRETYLLYETKGTFRYSPTLESLRNAHQDFVIRYRHDSRDLNRLVFLPDLIASGAGRSGEDWAETLKRGKALESSTGWVVESASISQETENESARGNPLIPTIEIPFSAFNASITAYQGELSLRRQVASWLPNIHSWITVGILVAIVAVTFHKGVRSRFPVPIFFLRLILTAVILSLTEQLVFDFMKERWEVYQLANLVTLFQALWWLMPAIWLIFLVERAMWEPIEKTTGYPVPSIARTTLNIAILGIAAVLIMNFVLDFTLTSIWAASGVLTLVLGVALQGLILDAATGLMINLERPFRIGEWIRTGDGTLGKVTEMNWRTTRVRTLTNDAIIVPNSVIGTSTLINHNDPDNVTGLEIKLRLGFDVPARFACRLMEEAAVETIDEMPVILRDPPPEANVVATDEYGPLYVLQVNFDVTNGEWDQVYTAVFDRVQTKLAENNITIPIPP